MAFDLDSYGEAWRPAFEAVQRLVGGRIVSAERQARWRPVFWLVVETEGGERKPICFRGARLEAGENHTARHEYECFRILERHGIPVPHVYGYCDEPAGFVMDRAPGRPDLATAESPAERDAVRDEFIDVLARMHALPLDDFLAVGLEPKASAFDLAMGDTAMGIARYRKARRRADPVVDFLIDWCERNAPPGREENVFLQGDAGQFIFEKGHLTAMLDMELAYLGDPLADLGTLFCRDLTETMGPLDVALDRYEAASGREVDRRVVLYHAIRFALTTPVATTLSVSIPHPATDYVQFLTWHLVYSRTPLELIAHLEGFELESGGTGPEPGIETPWSIAHDALGQKFEAFAAADDFQAYEIDAMRRQAIHLREADRRGPATLARDLDDVAEVLGTRPTDAFERDRRLVDLVEANAGDRDAELVGYFVRRIRREEGILRPAQRDLVDAHMQTIPLDPVA